MANEWLVLIEKIEDISISDAGFLLIGWVLRTVSTKIAAKLDILVSNGEKLDLILEKLKIEKGTQ